MHGGELDRVGLADPAALQAEFLLLGGAQVGQERAERGFLLLAGEGGRGVGEGVQVGPGGGGIGAGPGGDLDVEPERPLDFGHQVGQRPGHVGAQGPQLGGQGRQARVAGGRVGGRAVQVVERLDQAAGVPGQVGDGPFHQVVGALAAARRRPDPAAPDPGLACS